MVLVVGSAAGFFVTLIFMLIAYCIGRDLPEQDKPVTLAAFFAFLSILFFVSDISSFIDILPIRVLRSHLVATLVFFSASILLNFIIFWVKISNEKGFRTWDVSIALKAVFMLCFGIMGTDAFEFFTSKMFSVTAFTVPVCSISYHFFSFPSFLLSSSRMCQLCCSPYKGRTVSLCF
jgi:hypothetical protein